MADHASQPGPGPLWAHAFNAMTAPVLIVGPTREIQNCNQAFLDLWQASLPELVGHGCPQLVHGSLDPVAECPLENDFGGQNAVALRLTRGGQAFQVHCFPIRDHGQALRGVVHVFEDVTKQERSELAQKESEEKFAKVFKASPLWVAISTLDQGRYLAVNDSFTTTTGYTREEVLGRTSSQVGIWLDPDQRRRAAEIIQEQGYLREFPIDFRRKSGELGHALWSAEKIELDGEACIISILADVTHRLAAERELRRSESLLRNLFHCVPELFTVHDRDYGVVFSNWRGHEFLPESLREGKPLCHEVYMERDTPCPDCTVRQVFEEGRPIIREHYNPVIQATREVTAFPVRDDAGQVVLVAEHVRDLTQARQAQARIREQHEIIVNVLHSLNHPFLVIDVKDYSVVLSNLEPGQVFPSQPVACHQLLHGLESPCGGPNLPCPMHMIRQTGQPTTCRHQVRRPDTQDQVLEVFGYPVFDEAGNLIQIIEYAMDISQAEQDRKKMKALEAKLRQGQKMEAIGTLAGGIAHDFNNILGAVMGYAELALLNNQEGLDSTRELERIMRAAERARELVLQILSFSRQTQLQRKPLSLTPVIKEALQLLRASLPASVEIETDLTATSDRVLADPTQIHQVLLNLCTNAAHAMRQGGGVLRVSLAQVELDPRSDPSLGELDRGPCLRLSVADSGPGIDPAILDRIFEPFFTTKSQGEGTGMGLAVVHGIIESHDGAVLVDNRPGHGAQFHIHLPLLAPQVLEEPETGPTAMPHGRERVLLVDDEKALREVGRRMLEKLGYRVVTVASGSEALARMAADPSGFDLVITDHGMPRMSGLELARELHARHPGLPMVMCTGFSDHLRARDLAPAGVAKLLAKPLLMRELAQALRQALEEA